MGYEFVDDEAGGHFEYVDDGGDTGSGGGGDTGSGGGGDTGSGGDGGNTFTAEQEWARSWGGLKADGTIDWAKFSTEDPFKLGAVSGDTAVSGYGKSLSEIASTLGKSAYDQLKSVFTKKDANNNDVVDWGKLSAAGGALLGASGVLKQKPQMTGYQGGIPTYTAVQQQVPGTYDPTRRPGSSGQRYLTDVIQSAPADVASAKTAVGEQATGLAALNASNPAMQKRPVATVATVPTTTAPATVVADPASSVINKLEPTAEGLASVVNAASGGSIDYASGGGITALKGGNYLSGPTDGMADKLPANIEGNQEARLSHGEFVIPADVVSHLGNGNSDAGADRLYSMMDKIRKARTGTKKQGKRINPNKFLPGGSVGYAEGGIASFPSGGVVTAPAAPADPARIGTESNLSNWAGPYVTDMLGKGAALANTPYQSYSGPLTAGESAGQTAAFNSSAGLNVPTSQMGAFTPQTFTADQAQNYMNPYLSAALNPQMEEMRRQSQLNLQPNMAKLTQAGGYGGSRQALLQSESNRNLQTQQNAALGQGYQTAFDKAMGQFNTEQGRGLEAQTANNAYGLQALSKQAELGGQQRAIEQEGITADKAQFEEERNDPFTKLTFQQKLLQNLPVQAQSNNYQQSNWLDDAFTAAGGAAKFFDKIFATTPASSTTTTTPAP
tara:strand:- start:132 stop:2141 length:2010 start_codon:yes stop_codon:yes gene_type:complete